MESTIKRIELDEVNSSLEVRIDISPGKSLEDYSRELKECRREFSRKGATPEAA